MNNTCWCYLQEFQLNSFTNLTDLCRYIARLKIIHPNYLDYRIRACGVYEQLEGLRSMSNEEIEDADRAKQEEFQQYLRLKAKFG